MAAEVILITLSDARPVEQMSMSSHTDYTEEDTFNRLRRIPVSELESKLRAITRILRMNMHDVVTMDLEYERVEKFNRILKMFRLPTIGFEPRHIILGYRFISSKDYEHFFDGTGWTSKDYCIELKRLFRLHYSRVRALKNKKIKIRLMTHAAAIAISTGLAAMFSFSLIAILVFSVMNIVTADVIFAFKTRNMVNLSTNPFDIKFSDYDFKI